MKTNATTALFLLCIGALASCAKSHYQHSDRPNFLQPASSTVAEWTVMIFMNGKNNLEPDTITNFSQIASVGSTGKVNFLVELGRPKDHYPGAGSSWSGVRRFRVERDGDIDQKPLVDLGSSGPSADMGDPIALMDFLNWGFDHYRARHYILIIWNHGRGYRFLRSSRRDVREAGSRADSPESKTLLRDQEEFVPVIGGFRSVSSDEDTGNILYNRQIQDTLLTLSGQGKRLDIVAFDACLMNMLETAYALRNTASFMVASEELEPAEGWQYRLWAQPLVAAPTMSPKELSITLVNAYREEYQDDRQTTLSSIDLHAIPSASKAFGDFATALADKLESQRAAITTARKSLLAFGSTHGVKGNGSIDLQSFLEAFARATTDPDLRNLANHARSIVGQSVVLSYASSRMKRQWDPRGIAIYLPPSAADFRADTDSSGYFKSNIKFPIEFVQKYAWSTVVTQYLGVTSPSP